MTVFLDRAATERPSSAARVQRGAPHVDAATSGAIVIVIPLRRPPPQRWRRFFAAARPRRPRYSPMLVRVDDTTLSVTCPADEVGAWLVCVDLWIEEANERFRTWEAIERARPIDRLRGRWPCL